MKLCKDCRWMRTNPVHNDPAWARCKHKAAKLSVTNPVDGAVREHFLPCDNMRSTFGQCGPEARLFEAKDEGP